MVISSKNNYPTFEINQSPTLFLDGEPLLVDTGSGYAERNARISETEPGYFKVVGTFVPEIGDKVKGVFSGSTATISDVIENSGFFDISHSNVLTYGWEDQTGKLNESDQHTPDNDYYQNLSYSVKSKIDYEKLSNPVNSLLHTSGLKNFADLQVENTAGIGEYVRETNDIILLDVIEERRVDTINNFDTSQDIFTVGGKSRFVKLNNKTLADYFICESNRVLKIDDISPKFLNKEALTEDPDVVVDTLENNYQQYLVQIVHPASSPDPETQLTEVVVLNTGDNVYTFEKATLATTDQLLGNIQGTKDLSDNIYLGISPADLFDTDYDYKIIKQKYTSTDSTGIGTQSIGFVDLTSSNNFVGIATTSNIFIKNVADVESVYLNVFIQNVVTDKLHYAEVYVDHDSTDTYITEFSVDTNSGISSSLPGSFDASIESGNLIVKYTNEDSYGHLVQTSVVGFGLTSVGIGTYRFKDPLQLDGTERSARYESLYTVSSGISTNIIETNIALDASTKSIVRVSYGSTSALHQVMMVNNATESYTLQYPFLSIGSTSGIGTFGSDVDGTQVIMKFYPDASVVGEQLQIQSFNQTIYRDFDLLNLPPTLEYGTSSQSIGYAQYNAINGERRETSSFDATYEGIPIFKKSFTPYNTSQVNYETGLINIQSHFFQTGEELIYNPTSTFPGLSASSVGIGETLNSVGILTDILPSRVYAIKIDEDNIKLSTRKDYANAGIYVTFTSTGSGNAHELEMVQRDTKTIISLNGVVQKPLTYTPVAYALDSNPSGTVGLANTYISLTGIATIRSKDLMLINDEYVKVVNVGLATESTGPIVGFGTYKLAEVFRGSVGTSATTHSDGDIARVYRGAYTISGTKIHFTDPPKGNANEKIGLDNLVGVRDAFGGRVYLRKDYTKNVIYDDLSDQFTGIGQTFEITVQGISTTGIETGSGVVFINDIYQTPTTSNNAGNNYLYTANASQSFIEFTGITSESGDVVLNQFDVNQNQLPRGGVIVAFGSTNGLGYAPLVGVPTSYIDIVVGTGGSILSAGFTTSFIDGASLSATIGITTDVLTGIATGALTVGQRIKAVEGIIQPDTVVNSIGISSVFINNLSLNAVGIGTSVTFEGSIVYGSGYYGSNISIGVTDISGVGTGAVLNATIGSGGTITGFSVSVPGIGYTSPYAMVPEPSYENLPVIGVSRVATGATTETGTGLLVSLEVGASSRTGIGSTLFEVKSFKATRPGYNFEIGDVIKPVGLVTAYGLTAPIEDFELTVIDIFDDSFASWQFGELDFIDNIKTFQDGVRTRFPLNYNSQLLSIEIDPDISGSADIDLSSVLLIFINGVIQEPGVAYNFDGGTSFTFSTAPVADADISIYFYRGTRGVDSRLINITETIKNGDIIELYGSNSYPIQQDPRIVYNVASSDVLETNLYSGLGIDENFKRPLYWTKQKRDRYINGDPVYKTRDSIEAQIYPTAKLIWDFNSSDTTIFVDDAEFFKIEQNDYGVVIDGIGLLVTDGADPVSAKLSTTITSGEVTSVSIDNGGSGYGVTTMAVKFSNPPALDYFGNTGIGSTAIATAHLTSGIVTSITITSPGYGYTVAPQALVSPPSYNVERINGGPDGNDVTGFSGIITGITTTNGTGGHPLALQIFLQRRSPAYNFNALNAGYPIYITGTNIGYGVTSVGTEDASVVGIGTSFLDNIYYIQSISRVGDRADIICNIDSGTNIVGIATTGTRENPVGSFSWGRITNLTRSLTNPISIGVTGLVVDSGLSTFATAQRRKFGLRSIGPVRKVSTDVFDVITPP